MARGEDAFSILENSQSRSQFIDELMEVNISLLDRPVCLLTLNTCFAQFFFCFYNYYNNTKKICENFISL